MCVYVYICMCVWMCLYRVSHVSTDGSPFECYNIHTQTNTHTGLLPNLDPETATEADVQVRNEATPTHHNTTSLACPPAHTPCVMASAPPHTNEIVTRLPSLTYPTYPNIPKRPTDPPSLPLHYIPQYDTTRTQAWAKCHSIIPNITTYLLQHRYNDSHTMTTTGVGQGPHGHRHRRALPHVLRRGGGGRGTPSWVYICTLCIHIDCILYICKIVLCSPLSPHYIYTKLSHRSSSNTWP